MPRRPTKEFFAEFLPKIEKEYKGKDHGRAARVTASIWKKMKPATRRKYEKLRIARESRGKGGVGKGLTI